MKFRVKTINRFNIAPILGLIFFFCMWYGMGIAVLLQIDFDFYSLEDFLLSIINSPLQVTLSSVLLFGAIYSSIALIKTNFNKARYIAILKKVTKTKINDKDCYKLKFNIEFKENNKNYNGIEEKQECYISENLDLKIDEKYLVEFDNNANISYINNYDNNYKNIVIENPQRSYAFVFKLIYFMFLFPTLLIVLRFIFLIKDNNFYLNENKFYLLYLPISFILSFIVRKVDKKIDDFSEKDKEKRLIEKKKLELNNSKILEKSNLSFDMLCFLSIGLSYSIFIVIYFVIILVFNGLNFDSYMAILFSSIFAIVIGVILFIYYQFRMSDNAIIKRLNLKYPNNQNIANVKDFVILNYQNKYMIIDNNKNLLFKVKQIYLTYIVGDSNNNIVAKIKNKFSFFADEPKICIVGKKPFYCLYKMVPTFEYEIVGVDYKVKCYEKLCKYEITDLNDNVIASINGIKVNSKWSYVGSAYVEVNEKNENNLEIVMIALNVINSNKDFINGNVNTLVKVDDNGKSITKIN